MTEKERTVEVTGETTAPPDDRREHDPAVYGGDDLTTGFNDRVDDTATGERLGRVVGLAREDDRLTLTVETQDGRLAEFALADPAERRLDGRLRRLFHHVEGTGHDDLKDALVPLTTVDGEVAIDWERVPEAPANPSLDDKREGATGTDARSPVERVGSWAGATLTETLVAGVAGVSALTVLALGLSSAGSDLAFVAVAALQVVVAGLLVARARLLQSNAGEN